jgi:hypothetical protein
MGDLFIFKFDHHTLKEMAFHQLFTHEYNLRKLNADIRDAYLNAMHDFI